MYHILIWGHGLKYSQYINAIKYQEVLGNIKVIGVTGKDYLYTCLDGYQFISIEDIDFERIDYVVVTSEKYYLDIYQTVIELGVERERIIQAKVFCLPYFNFKNYVDLLHSRVSIIANNCWGGTVYHTLGMPFMSPFINMYENDDDYIKLISNLEYYLSLKLQFDRTGYNPVLGTDYPICKLNNVELHFNHYIDMREVEEKWYVRLQRLNWNNLFIMMYTERNKTLEDFDCLLYKKKICFVPFKSLKKSAFYMQVKNRKEMQGIPFWKIVNKTASGYFHDYDLIELLRHGTVNHERYYAK